MDKVTYDYSLKNIPIPSQRKYMKTLISKVESVVRRMRWKAFFYDKKTKPEEEEDFFFNYGFNTETAAPQNQELIPFENDLYNLLESVKFTNRKSDFQRLQTSEKYSHLMLFMY